MQYIKYLRYSIVILIFICPFGDIVGNDEIYQLKDIVVSANRSPMSARKIGSTVTVISREEIENRRVRFVTDLLRTAPGLAVSQTSNTGSQTQIRIRGNEADHTLVLIDGIEVSDVGNGAEFDFGHLLTTHVDRIEIIRGPQSALYGSDAIGGVINIITRQESAEKASGSTSAELGSFQSRALESSITTGGDWHQLSVFGSRFENLGANIARQGDEKDGYQNMTLGINGHITPRDGLRFEIVSRLTESEKDFDQQDFRTPTTATEGLTFDTDNSTTSSQIYSRIGGTLSPTGSNWKYRIGAAITDSDNDTYTNGLFSFGNEGQRKKYDYQLTYSRDIPRWADSVHTFTVAYEYEEIRFRNIGPTPTSLQNQRKDLDQDSLVGEYQLSLWNRLSISSGIRHDDNERFDDSTTYRLTTAYLIPEYDVKIHGSLGTGSTTPTFTELFGFFPGFFTGNPSLKPEKSRGYDVGVEKQFKEGRITTGIVYFNSVFDDKIVATFTTVANANGTSHRQGIELSMNASLTENLSISGSYTYTDAEDATNLEEVRRPRHSANLGLNYHFFDRRATINISMDYTGDQRDTRFFNFPTPSRRVTLDDYVLVNVATTVRLTENADLFVRVENLLDEDYENIFSFSTPGIGVFGGLTMHY